MVSIEDLLNDVSSKPIDEKNLPVTKNDFSLMTSQQWMDKREPEINRILAALSETKIFTVGDPTADLGKMHRVGSELRERQAYVGTYLARTIEMQLEVKRMLAAITTQYKDEMGKALDTYKEKLVNTRGLEERELRLRAHLPVIRQKEEMEALLENILLLKEAVQLVYDDMSKASMMLNLHKETLKNQILVGEIQIVNGHLAKVLQDSTVDAVNRAQENALPRGKSTL